MVFLIAKQIFQDNIFSIIDIPLWYWVSVCIISSVLWIVFYPKFIKRSVEKRISKILEEGRNTGILGNHNFSFTKEGVVDKTEFSETKYNLIEKVVESEAHIFIYAIAVMAYIIPIRIFGSADEKSEFLNILNKTLEVR